MIRQQCIRLTFVCDSPQDEVTYKQLTKNTPNRRTAAALFFELLQLKTLDFVDIKQSQAYGDISVSKATHFSDAIPALA